ncbi:hypothetical protein DASC09_060800 [Saccharomycopsis crataegensis]|uniref:GOLD domain-containing protein n=1 Tax=Saccharomycopsis crataegensis TaxID=43959 RepID=A0AAV5QVL0_9ASCO|nr:hypothetical protein DASC09_060800 [Saccharomycopsis crataegensis]
MIQRQIILLLLLFSSLIHCTSIGVVLPPLKPKDLGKGVTHCFRYPVNPNDLVVIRLNVGPRINGQSLNIKVLDSHDNLYRSKEDLTNKVRFAFSSSEEVKYFDVCLENIMTDLSWSKTGEEKSVVLDVEVGDDARNENSFRQQEMYHPINTDLQRVKTSYEEMERELAGLVEKEIRLRNINEKANTNYMIYEVVVIVILITVGICQLCYFKMYLRTKKLI